MILQVLLLLYWSAVDAIIDPITVGAGSMLFNKIRSENRAETIPYEIEEDRKLGIVWLNTSLAAREDKSAGKLTALQEDSGYYNYAFYLESSDEGRLKHRMYQLNNGKAIFEVRGFDSPKSTLIPINGGDPVPIVPADIGDLVTEGDGEDGVEGASGDVVKLRRRGFFDFFRRKDDEDDKEEKSEEKESGIGTRRFGSNDKRLRSNNLLRMEQDEPMDERNALIFKQITKREYELSKNGVKFTWAPTRRFWTTVTLKDAKGNRMASFITRGLRMRKIDVTIFTENKEIVPEIVLTAYLTLRGSRSSKMAKFKSFFFK